MSTVTHGADGTQWDVFETSYESAKAYTNAFTDVEVDVVFRQGDKQWKVPAFWAGEKAWTVRFAPPAEGKYSYRVECTDKSNAGLNGLEQTLTVGAYKGGNLLYRHGPLRIAADQRHFEHVDGTPFLWLADTWWKGLSKRLTWAGFRELAADRKAKGFNVVQIVCGPYPDEEAFHPGWANEGGMPYEDRAYTQLNPEYFKYADRRLALLVDSGIMPALVGAWGRSDCNAMNVAGMEGLKRHWRYLVARYAAYPLVLIPGGEVPGEAKYGEGDWGAVVKYLCEIDPYRRIKTSHEYACPQRSDKPLNDFEFIGGSHFAPKSAATLRIFTRRYAEEPVMPLVCGETGYEGHMQRHFADTQRYVFWMYMLHGAAGHTYGAAGLHHMGIEGDPGLKPIWDYTTWQQAKDFPGATQVGMGRKLLEQYPWHKFEPHPEWSDQDCFAAGIPGEVRVIYRSNRSTYDWTGPRLKGLEEGVAYRAFYFDPATGRRFDQGIIRKVVDFPQPFEGHAGTLLAEAAAPTGDLWERVGKAGVIQSAPAGVATDKDGEAACPPRQMLLQRTINEADVMVSVETDGRDERGIVLRFQNERNYLLAMYRPALKAIFVFQRRHGSVMDFFTYRIPYLGMVDVPEIGERFTLTAAACGEHVALMIDDGQRCYHTPPVKVVLTQAGRVGLWGVAEGEAAPYSTVKVSRAAFTAPVPEAAKAGTHDLRAGEDVAPSVPSPQDWVLVLERANTL